MLRLILTFFCIGLASLHIACTGSDRMREGGTLGNGKGFDGHTEEPQKPFVKLDNVKIRCEDNTAKFTCKLYVTLADGSEVLATGFEKGISVSFSLSGNSAAIAKLSCQVTDQGLSYICQYTDNSLPSGIVLGVALEVKDERSGESAQSNTTVAPARAKNSWRSIAPVPATFTENGAKLNARAVWTGSQALIWGGYMTSPGGNWGNSNGLIYDPVTDSWKAMSATLAPSARRLHAAVWTGKVMIIWGGAYGYVPDDGGMYDPVLDQWTRTSTANAPKGTWGNSFVWTGTKMITFGGVCISCGAGGTSTMTNTGATFDPDLNQWSPISNVGATDLIATYNMPHVSAFVGGKMFVFADGGSGSWKRVAVYDPDLDKWSDPNMTNFPNYDSTTVAAGNKLFAFGGMGGPAGWVAVNTGAIYDPTTDKWEPLPTLKAPSPRVLSTAVYTGKEVIVFGGSKGYSGPESLQVLNDGGVFDLTSKTWRPINLANSPSARVLHQAIWTGSEMLIFGGVSGVSEESLPVINSGGAFYP